MLSDCSGINGKSKYLLQKVPAKICYSLIASPRQSENHYNNGIVDAAAYVLRGTDLGSGTWLPNDNTKGVGPDAFDPWRAHFGQTAGGGS